MTNKNHTVLYIGVTSDLYHQTLEHKEHRYTDSFTAKYNCVKLIYYIQYSTIEEAITQEKKLKDRSRAYKEKLIIDLNPGWKDLWEDVKTW